MPQDLRKRLDQLRSAFDSGVIDQDTFGAAVASLHAQHDGSAALALGQGAIAVGAQGVGIGGNNSGTINTGVILNIHGDDVEKNRDLARVIYAATLLAPPLDALRKQHIEDYYNAIAQTLEDAGTILRQRQIPHGKCGEMLNYAENLPGDIADAIGADQASAFASKLMEAYHVEGFGHQFFHLPQPELDAKFAGLDEAAGYFRAAAKSLRVKR